MSRSGTGELTSAGGSCACDLMRISGLTCARTNNLTPSSMDRRLADKKDRKLIGESIASTDNGDVDGPVDLQEVPAGSDCHSSCCGLA